MIISYSFGALKQIVGYTPNFATYTAQYMISTPRRPPVSLGDAYVEGGGDEGGVAPMRQWFQGFGLRWSKTRPQ